MVQVWMAYGWSMDVYKEIGMDGVADHDYSTEPISTCIKLLEDFIFTPLEL